MTSLLLPYFKPDFLVVRNLTFVWTGVYFRIQNNVKWISSTGIVPCLYALEWSTAHTVARKKTTNALFCSVFIDEGRRTSTTSGWPQCPLPLVTLWMNHKSSLYNCCLHPSHAAYLNHKVERTYSTQYLHVRFGLNRHRLLINCLTLLLYKMFRKLFYAVLIQTR